MSDKPVKEKKAIIKISVPDAIKVIGVRTFYLGLTALILDSIVSGICVWKAPETFLSMDFMTAYFESVKDILIIVLLGKIVADKK